MAMIMSGGVEKHLATDPARYFPMAGGQYEVKPGLSRLGRSFGAGVADGRVFQVDREFPKYREGKLAARRERLGKYCQTRAFSRPVVRAVTRFMIDRLVREYPELYRWDGRELSCGMTGEVLRFDEEGELVGVEGAGGVVPPYASAFDALAAQAQEDLAVVSTGEGRHWLSALHLCFPNHWAAEEKIGRAFVDIHEPVAGMEGMNRNADSLVRLMVNATEGFVRFAWGISTDRQLNHHPEPPPGLAKGRAFDPHHPSAFVRVERQVIWGFPDVGAALFTIRTYFLDCGEIRRDAGERGKLISAIESMTPASLAYKGLSGWKRELLDWLSGEAGQGRTADRAG